MGSRISSYVCEISIHILGATIPSFLNVSNIKSDSFVLTSCILSYILSGTFSFIKVIQLKKVSLLLNADNNLVNLETEFFKTLETFIVLVPEVVSTVTTFSVKLFISSSVILILRFIVYPPLYKSMFLQVLVYLSYIIYVLY